MKNFKGTLETKVEEWIGDKAKEITLDQLVEIRAETFQRFGEIVQKFGEEAARAYGIEQVARDVAQMY